MLQFDEVKISESEMLLVWDGTQYESYAPYLAMLYKNDSNLFETLQTDKRRWEFVFTRVIIQQKFSNEQIVLSYTSQGKPLLSNGFHISISHSKKHIVILLSSKYQVGVDIQYLDAKILKAPDYFLQEEELKLIANDDVMESMHAVWCGKESMYKLYSELDLNMKTDIGLKSIDKQRKTLVFEVLVNKKPTHTTIYYLINSLYVLAYGVETIN